MIRHWWNKTGIYAIEVIVVAMFGFWYSSDYITKPRSYVPSGGDYGVSIFGRFFWDDVRSCGACALWNGNFMGGNPAFLDVSSDLFHPVAAIPSLLWGSLYGSRVTITITLILGGIACWWLAQVLGTGTIARLTAGFLGVTGGYLVGRLQHGLVVLEVSIVTASFLLPAALIFSRNPSRRNTALLGLFAGLTAISGQAYIQIAVIALAPLGAILYFSNRAAPHLIAKRLIQVAALTFAVSAVQVLPVLHWWDRLGKDTDFNFPRAQQFRFVPTNLVINDPAFYQAAILDREGGYPGLYSNYIGWIALILAVIGLVWIARRSWPRAAFLGSFIVGSLWLSSGMLFEWMSRWQGHPDIQNFAAGIRTPSNIANLAVPAIIGCTAAGLQWLLDSACSWHGIRIRTTIAGHPLHARLSLAIVVPILSLIMVRDVANQGRIWMSLEDWQDNFESHVASNIQSDELRWITDPSYNPRLQILASTYQLKIGNAPRPWWIDDKYIPTPWAYLGSTDAIAGYQPETLGDTNLLVRTAGNPYAQIVTSTGQEISCVATGRGGNIDIHCPSGTPGMLQIEERAFPGWRATVDGAPGHVDVTGTWLTVDLPQGASDIELTFRPRYFWIGAALSIIGVLWAAWWIALPGLGNSTIDWSHMRPRVRERRAND